MSEVPNPSTPETETVLFRNVTLKTADGVEAEVIHNIDDKIFAGLLMGWQGLVRNVKREAPFDVFIDYLRAAAPDYMFMSRQDFDQLMEEAGGQLATPEQVAAYNAQRAGE